MTVTQLGIGYRTTIKMCSHCGKPCYDKRAAQSAANRRFKDGHIKLRIYQCGKYWHLTHLLR